VWSTLTEADLAETGTISAHSEGIIDLLAQAEAAEVAIPVKPNGGPPPSLERPVPGSCQQQRDRQCSGGDHRALTLMRFMSDFREAMWGVVQQGISTLDFDYVDYAGQHFDRLARTAAESRFRAALS